MKQEAVVPAPPRDRVREALQELVACDEIVKHEQHENGRKVRAGRWKAAWEAARAALAEVVPRADEQDARRYRWLRVRRPWSRDGQDYRWTVARERGGTGECLTGDNLDAAVDAAMGDTP